MLGTGRDRGRSVRGLQRGVWPVAMLVVVMASIVMMATGRQPETEEPELRLRATTRVGFPPVEVLFIAELRGGSDDHEPLYCASVEWDWDDGTESERIPDCDPYEPGTSEIRRRFSQRHTFQESGSYEVRLNLKKRDEVILSARTTIEIRGSNRFR